MLILAYKESAPQYEDPHSCFEAKPLHSAVDMADFIHGFFVANGGAGRQFTFLILVGEISFQSLKKNYTWSEEITHMLIDTPPLNRNCFADDVAYEAEKKRIDGILIEVRERVVLLTTTEKEML